jgi:hypothetical protein
MSAQAQSAKSAAPAQAQANVAPVEAQALAVKAVDAPAEEIPDLDLSERVQIILDRLSQEKHGDIHTFVFSFREPEEGEERVKMQTVLAMTDWLADEKTQDNEHFQPKLSVNRKRDGLHYEITCQYNDLAGLKQLASDLADGNVDQLHDEAALESALQLLESIDAVPITDSDRAPKGADPFVVHIPVPPPPKNVEEDLYTSKNVAGWVKKSTGVALKSIGLTKNMHQYVNMQVVSAEGDRPRRVFLNFNPENVEADDVATIRRALNGQVWMGRVYARAAQGQQAKGCTYYVRADFKTPRKAE